MREMGMRINSNIAALNAHRNLLVTASSLSKSMEKLSSGLRINRAADDAAGLAISEKMRSQIKGLNQAMRNAQDGISMIQTAEGALNEVHSILQRMRELAVQGSSDTLNAEDRAKIVTEFDQLKSEIDRIATRTTFNNVFLLQGGLGSRVTNVGTGLGPNSGINNIVSTGASAATYTLAYVAASRTMTITNGTTAEAQSIVLPAVPTGYDVTTLNFTSHGIQVTVNSALTANISLGNTFDVTAGSAQVQVGANAGDTIGLSIGNMRINPLGLTAANVNTVANASTAIGLVDTAIGTVSTQRANLGAYQNRLEHTITNLGVASENLSAAESRIRDVDMAHEMMNFTKLQILQQAGTAMLAQANLAPQAVLQLLG
jgi:flagellin